MHRLLLAFASSVVLALFANAAPTDIPSAASFYVSSIPNLIQDPSRPPLQIFAGHVSSDPNARYAAPTDITAHLYFVMIKNRRVADRQRLMFWFNGGPGCSSFDGLMMENGPWRLGEDGMLRTVDGGWEEYTTMVYVDQPAGTGFSYTSTNKYVHDVPEAGTHFVQFLHNFYAIFPEYKNVDTYLGGESYAGQYIPFFADAILRSDLQVPLRGAAIGNGWIDAQRQYPSYISYAVKHGLIKDQSDTWKDMRKATEKCLTLLNDQSVMIEECEGLLETLLESDVKSEKGEKMCLNMYDVRLLDTSPACGMNWPKEVKAVTSYLARQDVVNSLHANAHPGAWQECTGQVHQQFHPKNSSITVLPSVLERGVPILIFAGDQDLICNYMGQEAMVASMNWNGETGLGEVETKSWTVQSKPAGTWVSSRNLTYVKIFNASHMAPYDYPHVAHDMILRFMGMNFSAIVDGDLGSTLGIKSSVGDETKPGFLDAISGGALGSGTSAEEEDQKKKDKAALLDQYYNTGTFALILLLALIALGIFIWWRIRARRRKQRSSPGGGVQLPGVGSGGRTEEQFPLRARNGVNGHGAFRDEDDLDDDATIVSRRLPGGKGKERDMGGSETVFEVGSEDEDEDHHKR